MASRQPKSRRRSGGRQFDHSRSVEWLAAEYGWSNAYVERELTDEQLVAYFDAASERRNEQSLSEFERAVETVRLGTGFLHDAPAYRRWKSRMSRSQSRTQGVTGQALEAAVMGLARQHPEYVVMGA